MATKSKGKKKSAIDNFFRITQNSFSKKYRVERLYNAGTPEEHWAGFSGVYETRKSAEHSMELALYSIKADLATWVPV